MKKIIGAHSLTNAQRVRLAFKRSEIRRDLLIRPLFLTDRAEYVRRSDAEHLLYIQETKNTPRNNLIYVDLRETHAVLRIYRSLRSNRKQFRPRRIGWEEKK